MKILLPRSPWSPLIGAVATFLIGWGSLGFFYQFFPMSFWSKYYSVVPAADKVKIGEPLQFKSTRIIRRPVVIKWEDTLRCELNGDYPPFSKGTEFARYIDDSTKERETVSWEYDGKLPDKPTTCFLNSAITQLHRGGIQRPQHLTDRHYINFIR